MDRERVVNMCKSMDFGGNSPKYPLSQEQLGIYFEAIQHPEWTKINAHIEQKKITEVQERQSK